MDPNHSSCWESILEKVKPHIPTIDFDSSPSENEEIAAIYERPAGLSLNLPEDFIFPVEDDGPQEPLKPAAQAWGCSHSVKVEDDEVTTAAPWGDAEVGACERGIVELNGADLVAPVKPNEDNPKSEEGFPVLSFARLDQWDLDDVLLNLKEDGLSLQQYVSVEPVKTHADGDKNQSNMDVMKRLIAFCNSQSTKSVPNHKSPNHIRENNVWNKPSVRMAAELQQSHRECPAVYIDLQCPDPSIKPPRTSSYLSSESMSPAKHNTHQETPPAKTPNVKVNAGEQTGDREVTGRRMLLQKIREMNGVWSEYPTKSTDPYSVLGNEAEELKDKHHQPKCSPELHHLWQDKQSSHVRFECRNPEMESPATAQQNSIRQPKSGQQRQQVMQTLQHEQILEQLEIHCPTKSVNQKQPAAERTDVLYHFEASHLQSISTLPAHIENKGCVLLMVDLSSPGVVVDRTYGRRKHLYPAATKSHIYNILVAWFLSLVGPDPRHDEDEAGAKVPFWVAGLQQLWTEDGLALHVLAVARHCYTPRKRSTNIHAPFYHHVCRFLSETSLTLIAGSKNVLVQQAYASPIHLPSSSLNCYISFNSSKKVIDRTFALSPGFYWQTVETQEHVCKGRETTLELHTEVSVAVGCKDFFLHPFITRYTLQLVQGSGLDVCGLRLLYPLQRFLSDSAGAVPVSQRTEETCEPVLALAVRGPQAHSVLQDLAKSLDPLLTRQTNPTSPDRLHCMTQKPPLLFTPRLAAQVHRELCLWFSGRLGGGGAPNHSWPLNRGLPSDDEVRRSQHSLSGSPSFLCATTKADLLLVVSPAVPPCCYGQVLAVCERRGFSLRGLQRLRLHFNAAAVLGLTNQQALVFCSPHTVALDQEKLALPSHCLMLLLRKENAMHHSVSLPAALIREFKAQRLLGHIHSRLDGVHTVESSFCFHTSSYRSNLFHIFVKSMWALPDPSSAILSHQKYLSTSNMEQVVILTLCGKDMSQGLSLLHGVLTEGPGGEVGLAGFELLGLKYLTALTRLHAQELSPYEVGEQLCPASLDSLASSPALVCALRRVDAFASLRKLLPRNYPGNLSVLMSPTPEVALRQSSLFFFKHEMIPDYRIPPLLKHLPPNCSTEDPRMLLTACLFKPRTWNHTVATIVRKLQLSGLTLVGLRVLILDKRNAASLLPAESDPSDWEAHVEYLCSGSSLALCFEGQNAVRRLLDVLGQDDSSLLTTCYASRSHQKAIQDVKRLFPEGLCCTETSTMRQEQMLSMCSDPLASAECEQSCTAVAQEGRSPSIALGPNGGSVRLSAVWQTTCLLMPLNTPPLSQVPSQLDMLEQLLTSGCHLVAGRMSTLDPEQRKHIAEILTASCRVNERMAHLSMAPCLIMAVQGEDVVTCFNLILDSIYKERSDLEKVGKMIIYPESEREAKQLILYLCDAVS